MKPAAASFGSDPDLHGERRDQRERQIAVRNGGPKRALPFRPIDVDVDPLMIAGAVRELLDPRLVYSYPAGYPEFASDEVVDV